MVYSNTTISTTTTLGIAALRDSASPGPDYGYHYDPLDYVFGGTTVNANITFTNGAAVGWFTGSGTDYGIRMNNFDIASFKGTATAPVWWVRGNTVQEQGGSVVWTGAGATGGLVGEAPQVAYSPKANLVFTHCSMLGFGDGGGIDHFRDDYGYLILNAEHSEFHGGACGGYVMSCYFTNCLLDRVNCLGLVTGRVGQRLHLHQLHLPRRVFGFDPVSNPDSHLHP